MLHNFTIFYIGVVQNFIFLLNNLIIFIFTWGKLKVLMISKNNAILHHSFIKNLKIR